MSHDPGPILRAAAAVVLDVDGVLVDGEAYQQEAWRTAGKQLGIRWNVPPEMLGSADEVIAAVLAPRDAGLLLKLKRDHTKFHHRQPPPLIPGVREFIAAAAARGLLLGVSSNSSHDRVLGILDHYGLTSAFAFIGTARGRCQPKPSPQVYEAVIAALGTPADATVAIEDSLVGIQSAKAAGLRAIALRTTCTSAIVSEFADAVVNSFADLVANLPMSEEDSSG